MSGGAGAESSMPQELRHHEIEIRIPPAFFEGKPGDSARHGSILQGIEVWQEVMELKDESDRAVSQHGSLVVAELTQLSSLYAHPPAIGLVEGAKQVQESALPRA